MDYREVLEKELQAVYLKLAPDVETRLATYCAELNRWNKRVNLTALSGAALVRRLVIEPLWIGRELGISGSLVDIGSGNGSPGIPLHIGMNMEQTHLVETRLKRIVFLRHIVSTLKLEGLHVHHRQFEAAASEIPPVEWVTLQAVVLNAVLLAPIRAISSISTRIVWITSAGTVPPIPAAATAPLPFSTTVARIFTLDQF